ncbi:MAG: hypothetical protein HON65_09520 [Rhodospirillales bacterium]|jgi:hypothetical protein|nr:hypothetical protein [Rhodospirillales bacterium]
MSNKKKQSPDDFMRTMIARMEDCPTAETLNENVIMPFALALEKVCAARGYLMNIYGESSNIVASSQEDAETIYHLIEEYLDNRQNDPEPKLD